MQIVRAVLHMENRVRIPLLQTFFTYDLDRDSDCKFDLDVARTSD
jgi:hypothetical protein